MADVSHGINVFWRYRLFQPEQAERLKFLRDSPCGAKVIAATHVARELDFFGNGFAHMFDPAHHAVDLCVVGGPVHTIKAVGGHGPGRCSWLRPDILRLLLAAPHKRYHGALCSACQCKVESSASGDTHVLVAYNSRRFGSTSTDAFDVRWRASLHAAALMLARSVAAQEKPVQA